MSYLWKFTLVFGALYLSLPLVVFMIKVMGV